MNQSSEEARHWPFKKKQEPWNKGTGGCKRGHDPSLYQINSNGVYVCVGCRRENAAKYRDENKDRLYWVKRVQRYGITVRELDSIFNSQRGKCVICNYIFTDGDYDIDHDHETGKVRGLLCHSCNTGIGILQESPALLIRAAEYLTHYNE